MNLRTARIGVMLVLVVAVLAGGFVSTAAAHENAASDCGNSHGVHNAVGLGPGAEFGHGVSHHAQTIGPPGEVAVLTCSP